MKKSALKVSSKVMLLIAAASLVFVIKLPIWRIELDAPQYPEGLALQIHANDIKGDVDIINGLNHYIGMKTLHKEDFIEFAWLPYIIVFFASLFLLTAIVNRKKFLYFILALFISFGILAMIDFWRWEYDYGHNLNPDAAIRVPGMAYQPPLIGFKQLLNFGAFSIPDIGGWIFIGAGLLLVAASFLEWRHTKKIKSGLLTLIPFFMIVLMSGCASGPEPLVLGKDNCYLCKMTLTDPKYGGEIITNKGKVYKFDDIDCLLSYMKATEFDKKSVKTVYLVDYAGEHKFVEAGRSVIYKSEELRTPMNGFMAAFQNSELCKKSVGNLKGVELKWSELINK
jgi:copper chaperone NosL